MSASCRAFRVARVILTATVLSGLPLPVPAIGQTHAPTDVMQWENIRPLFKLVEDVAAGITQPSDVTSAWQVNFFMADSGVVFVPFTMQIDPDAFTTYPLGMYVRVVLRGAPAPSPGPRDALAQYPFEDGAVVERPVDGRISRAFTAPPGKYDVYIGLTDGIVAPVAPDAPPPPAPRQVVIKREVDIPAFGPTLTTSSVVVLESSEVDTSGMKPSFEDQLNHPYTLWGLKLTPAFRRTFSRQEELRVIFLVYNAQLSATGKPDVEVRYNFLRKSGADEVLFTRTPPERLNAETLGPSFDATAGHVAIAGQQVPLASFVEGEYRLEITVVDRSNGSATIRNVNFTVGPS
jgi:hypothetical protein